MKSKKLQSLFSWLFASDVKYRIISYFINNPETRLHLRGIQRLLKTTYLTTRKECRTLEDIGFFKKEVVKKNHLYYYYYSLDKSFVFYSEFKSMFNKAPFYARPNKLNRKEETEERYYRLHKNK